MKILAFDTSGACFSAAIVIDGQIKYISLVPSVKELRETILKAVELKK